MDTTIAIIFAFIVVVVIPVGFLMSTTLLAGVLGALLKTDAEKRNENSELLETNY